MTEIPPYTDETIMHYGNKHRGKKLKEVPASYLIWCFENDKRMPYQLAMYCKDNMKALEKERDKEKAEFFRDKKNQAR